MINLLKQKNRGFTLVETLVAISIFTLSILSVMSVLSSGIKDTTYAKQKITAEYLAQEGIEYVRNMRDTYVLYQASNGTSWASFVAKMIPCNLVNSCGVDVSASTIAANSIFACATHPNQCKLYVSNGNYNIGSPGGVDSGFVRTIKVSPDNPADDPNNPASYDHALKITSDVSWRQGSGIYHATFSENLFNWIQP